MREFRSYGSVREAPGDGRPYRDRVIDALWTFRSARSCSSSTFRILEGRNDHVMAHRHSLRERQSVSMCDPPLNDAAVAHPGPPTHAPMPHRYAPRDNQHSALATRIWTLINKRQFSASRSPAEPGRSR
jgi:hypothetical protein